MSAEQSPDPELDARLAWIGKVRRLHHVKRMIGFAGIVLGAFAVIWWKLDAAAPDWALWTGVGILLLSWALFIYVIVARWLYVKNHPYTPPV